MWLGMVRGNSGYVGEELVNLEWLLAFPKIVIHLSTYHTQCRVTLLMHPTYSSMQ